MQTTRNNMEMRTGPERAIRMEMPEPRVLVAAAIAGGTIAAGLVLYYYLRKRRRERMGY
ncbi:MAG: hypothetical protein AB1351_02550 [Thermoproteota archaeon]